MDILKQLEEGKPFSGAFTGRVERGDYFFL